MDSIYYYLHSGYKYGRKLERMSYVVPEETCSVRPLYQCGPEQSAAGSSNPYYAGAGDYTQGRSSRYARSHYEPHQPVTFPGYSLHEWIIIKQNYEKAFQDLFTACESVGGRSYCSEALSAAKSHSKDLQLLLDSLKLKWDCENSHSRSSSQYSESKHHRKGVSKRSRSCHHEGPLQTSIDESHEYACHFCSGQVPGTESRSDKRSSKSYKSVPKSGSVSPQLISSSNSRSTLLSTHELDVLEEKYAVVYEKCLTDIERHFSSCSASYINRTKSPEMLDLFNQEEMKSPRKGRARSVSLGDLSKVTSVKFGNSSKENSIEVTCGLDDPREGTDGGSSANHTSSDGSFHNQTWAWSESEQCKGTFSLGSKRKFNSDTFISLGEPVGDRLMKTLSVTYPKTKTEHLDDMHTSLVTSFEKQEEDKWDWGVTSLSFRSNDQHSLELSPAVTNDSIKSSSESQEPATVLQSYCEVAGKLPQSMQTESPLMMDSIKVGPIDSVVMDMQKTENSNQFFPMVNDKEFSEQFPALPSVVSVNEAFFKDRKVLGYKTQPLLGKTPPAQTEEPMKQIPAVHKPVPKRPVQIRPSYVWPRYVERTKVRTPQLLQPKVDADGWETVKSRSRTIRDPENTKKINGNKQPKISIPSFFVLSPDTSVDERERKGTIKKDSNGGKLKAPLLPCWVDEDTLDSSRDSDLTCYLECEDQKLNEEQRTSDLEEQMLKKSHELKEEEIMLTKKIQDLESTEIDLGGEEDLEEETLLVPSQMHADLNEYLESIPWSDQVDVLEEVTKILNETDHIQPNELSLEHIEELVARHPHRAHELYLKWSSRKRREESEEKSQARRQKADAKRQQLLSDKAAKMRELVQKVEEVRSQQRLLTEERKERLHLKLKKAEENRNQHLRIIRKKAHDEEEKLREIAFINELEAQNRRHESMALRQEQEERLQNILEERQRKSDEKAAKEAAVEERRRVLEAERQEKLEKMQEKRRKKEETIGRRQQEKENKRLVIAREKAREREERLQAMQAAQIATMEELQKKIQQKQENSARRHEESIELIRQKALEAGMMRTMAEDSSSNFSKYSSPDDAARKCGDDIMKAAFANDNLKSKLAQKKKLKKVRARLAKTGEDYVNAIVKDKPDKCEGKVFKHLKRLASFLESYDDSNWKDADKEFLYGIVKQLKDSLEKHNSQDIVRFRECGGFLPIITILRFEEVHKDIPNKLLLKTLDLIRLCCNGCHMNSEFFIFSNYITVIVDVAQSKIETLTATKKSAVVESFLSCLTDIFQHVKSRAISSTPEFRSRINDLVRFSGVIKYATICSEDQNDLVGTTVKFLSVIGSICGKHDAFLEVLLKTDLMGLVSLLYARLQGTVKEVPGFTEDVLEFCLSVAQLDIRLFQKILGAEGVYLQFRHIAGFLLSFCSQEQSLKKLFQAVIKLIGYFCVKNSKNQALLHSGLNPTVVQQLIASPFAYFCEPQLVKVLYPTLLCCSYANESVQNLVKDDISYSTLEQFPYSEDGKNLDLIKTFLKLDNLNNH